MKLLQSLLAYSGLKEAKREWKVFSRKIRLVLGFLIAASIATFICMIITSVYFLMQIFGVR